MTDSFTAVGAPYFIAAADAAAERVGDDDEVAISHQYEG